LITADSIIELMKASNLATQPLVPDVPLTQQGVDSLDFATFLHDVEVKFEKRISPQQAVKLRTINDIVAFLNS
jgi:acyl carrier protein